MTQPALPHIERIALAIVGRLATVQTANDYAFDLVEIARPQKCGAGWTPQAFGVRLLQGAPQLFEGTVGNPPSIEIFQPYQLDMMVAVGPSADMPAEAMLNLMASEINRAMMTDPQWFVNENYEPDAAGEPLAELTRLAAILYPEPTLAVDLMTMVYEVQCRVAENDFRVRV